MVDRKGHNLKIHTQYFDHVLSRLKQFEIRKNDRDFKVGDFINLQETDSHGEQYTGRELVVEITYITEYNQLSGFVVLGIKRLDDIEENTKLNTALKQAEERIKQLEEKIMDMGLRLTKKGIDDNIDVYKRLADR